MGNATKGVPMRPHFSRGPVPGSHRMLVEVFNLSGGLLAATVARDFDQFGSSPDHHEVIAPLYLRPLTNGLPAVYVRYHSREGTFTERHEPGGWNDGKVVGTNVSFPTAEMFTVSIDESDFPKTVSDSEPLESIINAIEAAAKGLDPGAAVQISIRRDS